MKSHLNLLKNEQGFYLPFVLIVSLITLSALMTSTYIYQNESRATNLLLEHLELETMRRVTIDQFKSGKPYQENTKGEYEFELPNAHSYGNYEVIDENVTMSFYVETENLTYHFNYRFTLTINEP